MTGLPVAVLGFALAGLIGSRTRRAVLLRCVTSSPDTERLILERLRTAR